MFPCAGSERCFSREHMDAAGLEASPIKAVSEELDHLRAEFRSALENYATRVEADIAGLQETVLKLSSKEKIPAAKLRDLRDMLTLLRGFSIKPEKGRRKDLKKIDSLLDDLALLLERW